MINIKSKIGNTKEDIKEGHSLWSLDLQQWHHCSLLRKKKGLLKE